MAGLWGSGNAMFERELQYTGEETVYEMWTGSGILGPREGVVLERLDALWGRTRWSEFVARYAYLPPAQCKVFRGEEVLGIGCDEACAAVEASCEDPAMAELCRSVCAELPRSLTTCLANLDASCDFEACAVGAP